MSKFKEQILDLTNQLLPTGRAFNNNNVNGPKDGLIKALSESMDRAVNDSNLTLDSVLPDNDNFTADDATRWEERLGMITNTSTTLSDRKLAIIVKLNHPGDIPARQSGNYLQDVLQAAGFNVYVHENLQEQTITQVLSNNQNITQLGQKRLGTFRLSNVYTYYNGLFSVLRLGQTRLGTSRLNEYYYTQVIANKIDYRMDTPFNVGTNLKRTFFIGGSTLGEFANIDINRREEFRQLILKTKPIRTVGYLLINYT